MARNAHDALQSLQSTQTRIDARRANALNNLSQKRATYEKLESQLRALYDELETIGVTNEHGADNDTRTWRTVANEMQQKMAQLERLFGEINASIGTKNVLDSVSPPAKQK